MATTLNKSTRILWLLLEFPALFLLDYYFMNLPPLHFALVVLLLCLASVLPYRCTCWVSPGPHGHGSPAGRPCVAQHRRRRQ